MRVCNTCGLEKPLSDFYKSKTGYRRKCKACVCLYFKEYRAKDPERLKGMWRDASRKYYTTDGRRNKTLRQYGLTEETYNLMFDEQKGACKLCGSTKALAVDHCHSSGIIRGLLCYSCNTGLGHFKDNTEVLQKAIEYLQRDRSIGRSPGP